MLGTARKKPIEVYAIRYKKGICDIDTFYNWLQTQSEEPISRDENTNTIYIHKERGVINLPLGN
mgnify:FL=1